MRARAVAAVLFAAAALATVPPLAAGQDPEPAGTKFHFGVNAARTTILFTSETDLETITGVVRAMSGTAHFEFEKGEGVADLHVQVKDMDTGLPTRNGHLQGADWLEADKFPEIVFAAKSLKRTKVDDATKKETWSYEGELTIHGVTKPLKGESTVQRVPPEIGKTLGQGDWVKVKTEFPVALKDFGIKVPERSVAKVQPTWTVKVDIFGTTVVPEPKK
jgi:polyisoprenoid-binding protein YceI